MSHFWLSQMEWQHHQQPGGRWQDAATHLKRARRSLYNILVSLKGQYCLAFSKKEQRSLTNNSICPSRSLEQEGVGRKKNPKNPTAVVTDSIEGGKKPCLRRL